MKKLLISTLILVSTSAFAWSDGQAAIAGGIIGYIAGSNRPSPPPTVYQYGYPPAPPPQVIVVPGYGTQIIQQPHVNDICATATYINGVYDPGRAQWVCRYGGNGVGR